ncbi:ester cyclase [Pseudomonas aeruginosa]|uniref:ester cyclase n=1 Tax=Pseudomonas aeruginosa TaxID=287 RepID=UPI000FC41DBB|nr:ester cyclase [Pseudomonas aeruginosa]NPT07727.1 SnoaL-like domain-containing protein [Pseudomonas aeruginosa]RUC20295.1 hypothetical protein IPC1407_14375 [Pseudomonas aeruginosa]TEC80881.1 hypothetical protein IPC1585_20700 [Pseudomonas aeruginosa]HBN8252426.1 ester cyclase [Pseudomonas aeruginosa]HBN8477550.1 ester cyclase [Pseudomonas aeruginosa]
MRYNDRAKIATLILSLFIFTTGTVSAESKNKIEKIVREFHINYSNNQVEKNGDLVANDIIVEVNGGSSNGSNGATVKGRQQFVNWLKQDKAIFPDSIITDHEVVVSGNKAAVRFTQEGTHLGPYPTTRGNLPPTGRRVVIQATEFFTFNDEGKLIHLETLTNDLGAITQLTKK